MPPGFGTSGLRGQIKDLTPNLVGDHIRAFLRSCDTGGAIWLGWDLRPSSPGIAQIVNDAARKAGCDVVICGAVPTPALAWAAGQAGQATVMITGSHIPADRNGIKFYSRHGEITKTDEAAITNALDLTPLAGATPGAQIANDTIGAAYVARYVAAFGSCLKGQRIGVYAHSAVGRDLLAQVLPRCGAEVIELGRSDQFVALDTEAISDNIRDRIKTWVARHRLDALVSTDGDSDRPLLADETGNIVAGDVLGQISAEVLGAQVIVTPVSANSGVDRKAARVIRTRIGSPHVIKAMAGATGRVVGYEPNGGFLLGFAARGLSPLITRDAVLPILCALAEGPPLSQRVAQEPAVFTATGLLRDMPWDRARAYVEQLCSDRSGRAAWLARIKTSETSMDTTDGLRMMLADGRVIHIRPSGNAPEMRIYTEAGTPRAADALRDSGLAILRADLS